MARTTPMILGLLKFTVKAIIGFVLIDALLDQAAEELCHAHAAGIGLLLSERLSAEQRRAVALTLIGVGVITTVPALFAVLGGRKTAKPVAA